MYDANTIIYAFTLTLLAGLSTGIGSALAFFTKETNTKFLSVALGFSAGVMIYVSFMEILCESQEYLMEHVGKTNGMWIAIASFFGGIFLIAIIDKLIPSFENPHEIHKVEELYDREEMKKKRKLLRVGVFTATAIAVHNFPEGLSTFAAAITDAHLGLAIAVAIAIHNIPEGIAVSIPIFYATKSRKKAFIYSFLSGLAEVLGAIVGLVLFVYILNGIAMGILLGAVAGIMVFISLDQLLPTAREYGEHHLSIYGLLIGMAVMAISILLIQ